MLTPLNERIAIFQKRRGNVRDIVSRQALSLHGGDDYLTKPFALPELLTRRRNLLRRAAVPTNESVRLQAADLQLDLVRREARRGDQLLQFDPTRVFSAGISLPE